MVVMHGSRPSRIINEKNALAAEEMDALAGVVQIGVAELRVPRDGHVGIEDDMTAFGYAEVVHVATDLVVGLFGILLVIVLERHTPRQATPRKRQTSL